MAAHARDRGRPWDQNGYRGRAGRGRGSAHRLRSLGRANRPPVGRRSASARMRVVMRVQGRGEPSKLGSPIAPLVALLHWASAFAAIRAGDRQAANE